MLHAICFRFYNIVDIVSHIYLIETNMYILSTDIVLAYCRNDNVLVNQILAVSRVDRN